MMEVIEKIEVTQKELFASGEDFDYEIKCSQSKKKMFNEEIENLKKNIDKIEARVNRSVINLKDL